MSGQNPDEKWLHEDPVLALFADERPLHEVELELLKIGVMNPELYNNLRSVFIDHKYPDKLDQQGQRLRTLFLNLGK